MGLFKLTTFLIAAATVCSGNSLPQEVGYFGRRTGPRHHPSTIPQTNTAHQTVEAVEDHNFLYQPYKNINETNEKYYQNRKQNTSNPQQDYNSNKERGPPRFHEVHESRTNPDLGTITAYKSKLNNPSIDGEKYRSGIPDFEIIPTKSIHQMAYNQEPNHDRYFQDDVNHRNERIQQAKNDDAQREYVPEIHSGNRQDSQKNSATLTHDNHKTNQRNDDDDTQELLPRTSKYHSPQDQLRYRNSLLHKDTEEPTDPRNNEHLNQNDHEQSVRGKFEVLNNFDESKQHLPVERSNDDRYPNYQQDSPHETPTPYDYQQQPPPYQNQQYHPNNENDNVQGPRRDLYYNGEPVEGSQQSFEDPNYNSNVDARDATDQQRNVYYNNDDDGPAQRNGYNGHNEQYSGTGQNPPYNSNGQYDEPIHNTHYVQNDNPQDLQNKDTHYYQQEPDNRRYDEASDNYVTNNQRIPYNQDRPLLKQEQNPIGFYNTNAKVNGAPRPYLENRSQYSTSSQQPENGPQYSNPIQQRDSPYAYPVQNDRPLYPYSAPREDDRPRYLNPIQPNENTAAYDYTDQAKTNVPQYVPRNVAPNINYDQRQEIAPQYVYTNQQRETPAQYDHSDHAEDNEPRYPYQDRQIQEDPRYSYPDQPRKTTPQHFYPVQPRRSDIPPNQYPVQYPIQGPPPPRIINGNGVQYINPNNEIVYGSAPPLHPSNGGLYNGVSRGENYNTRRPSNPDRYEDRVSNSEPSRPSLNHADATNQANGPQYNNPIVHRYYY